MALVAFFKVGRILLSFYMVERGYSKVLVCLAVLWWCFRLIPARL